MKTLHWMVACALFLALPSAAQEAEVAPDGGVQKRIEVEAELLNLAVLLNDRDYDRTEPAYNAERQHAGFVGTLLRPGITFHILDGLRIRYQAEVGLNMWSRNNADQLDPTASDIFLLLHRQMYAEGETVDGAVGFKAGYDRWLDPTSLMMAHWTGAAEFRAGWQRGSFALSAGLLPDATYEGWNIIENNFSHDTFFAHGGVTLLAPSETLVVQPGVSLLVDGSEVGRQLTVAAPYLHLVHTGEKLTLSIDLMGQLGNHSGAAADGGGETQAAWAAQVHGDAALGAVNLQFNLLALSPDDSVEGNGINGAFRYSGLSRSPTLWLSENDSFDLWNNVDERLGTRQNSHFLMRMGLVQADVRLEWLATDVFQPALIVGGATALAPANALGQAFVGVEVDADLTFRHGDVLEFHAIPSVFIPGGAAAAAINEIDRGATDPQVGGMAILGVNF